MSTLPSQAELVQSLAQSLAPVLKPLVASLPLVELMQGADKTLRDAVLQAACLVIEQALCQPQRPERAAYKKTFHLHSALGTLNFVRWGTWDQQGQLREPLPHALWGHGCTAAVREQLVWLHAFMTTQETSATMRLFHAAEPSVSTVHRVALDEGCALAKQFSPELFGTLLTARVRPIAEQIHLVVLGADGGHVPMRGETSSAARQWHEGRVVTATFLGAVDPNCPRTVTLLDGQRREHRVGSERPVLATVVLGQMPTLQGPRAERVQASLKKLHEVVKTLCPQARWQGLCDGGEWPESLVDAIVGSERRTTDCMHASSHLLNAARAQFEDEKQAMQWWTAERTRLLTRPANAERLVKALTRSVARLPHAEDKKRLQTEVGYFRKRKENMAYAERLAANEAIGSGPTEAAVKQLLTVRMKRVGATWGADGGDAVMHSRSLAVSQLFDGAWQERLRQQFAPYQTAA
jgi:hypothetical protein